MFMTVIYIKVWKKKLAVSSWSGLVPGTLALFLLVMRFFSLIHTQTLVQDLCWDLFSCLMFFFLNTHAPVILVCQHNEH